jgi:hypothetical protein
MGARMSDEIYWQTAKEYRSETAGELADLISIQRDLNFTIRGSELALDLTSKSPSPSGEVDYFGDDMLRRTSLWNSALVAYARCFTTGIRQVRLSIDMFNGLGDKAQEAEKAHTYFMNLRNKYVAPSVNRFEDIRVILLVGDGVHSQSGVVGGGPFLMWPAEEKPDNVRSLCNLARFLKGQVELRVGEKAKQMLEEAKKLTDDELASLPDMNVPVPVQPDEAGKPRPR